MTDKEILEGNKLIAEFMGWTCSERKSYNDGRKVLYNSEGKIFKYSGHYYLLNENPWDAPLKFHESWDWIMPVVEKIESLNSIVTIHKKYCSIFTIKDDNYDFMSDDVINEDSRTKLQAIYTAVIEFIKWYNDNK